MSHVLPV